MGVTFSALREEKYGSAIALIKALQENSTAAKITNLQALIINVPSFYEPLTKILSYTGNHVSTMISELWNHGIRREKHFYRFLAMTMRAIQKQDWFDPKDEGELH